MFSHPYWPAQYFPPVWFAPADEDHLTPEETERTPGGRPVRLRRFAEADVWLPGYGLELARGALRVQGVESGSGGNVVITAGGGLLLRSGVPRVHTVQKCDIRLSGIPVELEIGYPRALSVMVGATLVFGARISVCGGAPLVSTGGSVMLVGDGVASGYGYPEVRTIQNPSTEELFMLIQRQRAQGVSHGRT